MLPSAKTVWSSCRKRLRISALGREKVKSGLCAPGERFRSCSKTVKVEEPLASTRSPKAFVPYPRSLTARRMPPFTFRNRTCPSGCPLFTSTRQEISSRAALRSTVFSTVCMHVPSSLCSGAARCEKVRSVFGVRCAGPAKISFFCRPGAGSEIRSRNVCYGAGVPPLPPSFCSGRSQETVTL